MTTETTPPTYFYSPASGGFYMEDLHEAIPEDAIALSEAEWRTLLEGLSQGGSIIGTDTGMLSLQPPEPVPDIDPPPSDDPTMPG